MSLDIELLDDDLMDNSFVRSLFGDTDSESATVWGGSRDGRSTNLHRAFRLAEERFHRDYFAESHINPRNGEVVAGPVYPEAKFVKRYRMSTALFQKICRDLAAWDTFFTLKRDATGLAGIAPEIKIAASIRQLASSEAADDEDQYFQLSESTAAVSLEKFCEGIRAVYEEEWLRAPNEADLELILAHSSSRGFPGMLGSIDCMHWAWDKCPTAYKGQYQGKEGVPTIVLEAVA